MVRKSQGMRKKSSVDLPLSFEAWAEAARKAVEPRAYSYLEAPGGEGLATRANFEAFYKWRLIPRVLRNTGKPDLSVTLFGAKLPAPILLAPVGSQISYHPGGELESAKAAASSGIPFILSTVASYSIEDVAKVMGSATRWFQLFPSSNREFNASLLHRARKSGYSAIVITVDRGMYPQYNLVPGYKPITTANYYSDPILRVKLEKMGKKEMEDYIKKIKHSAEFSWSDLEFVKQESGLPVILKGITHPKDAELAVSNGADGIIVSNHGARHQDGVVASMDALPAILDVVQGRIPVLLDSGVRGGVYAVKALALGATAVDIGRLYVYGLAVGGEAGVSQVIKNMISEIEISLAFCGCGSIKELDRSIIRHYD